MVCTKRDNCIVMHASKSGGCMTGQEGHSIVAGLRGAIPDTWRPAGTAESASSAAMCAADGLNFTAVCEGDAGFEALATTNKVSSVTLLTPRLSLQSQSCPYNQSQALSNLFVTLALPCCLV